MIQHTISGVYLMIPLLISFGYCASLKSTSDAQNCEVELKNLCGFDDKQFTQNSLLQCFRNFTEANNLPNNVRMCLNYIATYKNELEESFHKRTHDNIAKLKNLEVGILRATGYMNSRVKYEDSVVFFGITKSGKSSLINYIIGNKLMGNKTSKYTPVSLVVVNPTNGPKIGDKSTSETVLPMKYISKRLSSLALWDTPGFGDNRGPIQDITNSIYINGIFKNVKSAKIILVVDINDIIQDSIKSILSLLRAVEKLLKHFMSNNFESISIIFSKVPDQFEGEEVNKEFICGLLEQKLLSTSHEIDISSVSKNFIKYLIENPIQIGLFKKPSFGEVTDAISDGIIEAINSTTSLSEVILKKISPSISTESELFLYNIREELSSPQMFVDLRNLVSLVIKQKLMEFENLKKSNPTQDQINSFSQELISEKKKLKLCLNENANFEIKITTLGMMNESIADFISKNNLNQKAKYMELADQLLQTGESKYFNTEIDAILISALQKNEEFFLWTKELLNEISKAEREELDAKMKIEYNDKIATLKSEIEKLVEENEQSSYPSNSINPGSGLFGTIFNITKIVVDSTIKATKEIVDTILGIK